MSVVLAHFLPSDQSGPNFCRILWTHCDCLFYQHLSWCWELAFIIYYSISCSCDDCYIFYLFEESFISKLGLPAFLKVGLATLHLALQEFTEVLLKLHVAYLDENFLIADAVPQTFAYMPTSIFIVSETIFWYFASWLPDFCLSLATSVNSAFMI